MASGTECRKDATVLCPTRTDGEQCGFNLIQSGKKAKYCSECGWKVDWKSLEPAQELVLTCGGTTEQGALDCSK